MLLSVSVFTGCATIEEPKYPPVKDYEARLAHARKERDAFRNLLQKAQSVDDTIKIKEQLSEIQTRIEELEAGKKARRDIDAGFKSTKKRTIVYGPLGWITVGVKWIVEKLYICYPWDGWAL
jgi:hypothetical protein